MPHSLRLLVESADNTSPVSTVTRRPKQRLVLRDLTGANAKILANNADALDSTSSPDGKTIFFALGDALPGSRSGGGLLFHYRFFLVAADGTQPRPVWNGNALNIAFLGFSPDGTGLSAELNEPVGRANARTVSLVLVNTRSNSAIVKSETMSPSVRFFPQPLWAPDSRSLWFTNEPPKRIAWPDGQETSGRVSGELLPYKSVSQVLLNGPGYLGLGVSDGSKGVALVQCRGSNSLGDNHAVSQNGRLLALEVQCPNGLRVITTPLGSKAEPKLVDRLPRSGTGIGTVQVSNSGRVLYSFPSPNGQTYRLSLGGSAQPIDLGPAGWASLTPGGRRVWLLRSLGGSSEQLAVYDVKAHSSKTLSTIQYARLLGFSPDGRKVLVQDATRITAYDVDGQHPQTFLAGQTQWLAWSTPLRYTWGAPLAQE
ncbi:MAG: TolB family protein [Chloroflexota bacterium]